jgi:hypothetical protein
LILKFMDDILKSASAQRRFLDNRLLT